MDQITISVNGIIESELALTDRQIIYEIVNYHIRNAESWIIISLITSVISIIIFVIGLYIIKITYPNTCDKKCTEMDYVSCFLTMLGILSLFVSINILLYNLYMVYIWYHAPIGSYINEYISNI